MSRRAGLVGGLTLLSRIAGLVRDMVIAYFFGTRMAADAFYVAFRIPNLLRRLLAEGALTMAFVPIFTEHMKRSREEGRRAADVIFTSLCILLLLIVVVGIAFAPWIVKAIALGFSDQPEKFALTVRLTRLMFPYIFLVSVMALMMGMLNSLKHFAAPAGAPIILNLAIICGAAVFSRWFAEPTIGLAIGVLIGGCLQVAVQVGPLVRERMVPRFTAALRHPALSQLVRIMLPSVYGGAVYQLNVMVITLLASFLPNGSVSYLWYADRITEFPLGIFAVAIATVTLPALSDHAAEADLKSFRTTANFSLRVAFSEAIPAAVGIILLATPIVRLLFEGGAFTDTSTKGTAAALVFFAVGIPFVSGVRNIVPAFYALKDARTPVLVATLGLIVNASAALLLMQRFLHQGLAMAMAISAAVHFATLLYFLRRKLGMMGIKSLARGMGGCLIASTVMGIVVYLMSALFALDTVTGRAALSWRIALVIATACAIYFPLLRLLAREEFDHFVSLFHLKGSRK